MSRFGALIALVMVTGLVGCGGPPRGDWSLAVTSAELAEVGLNYFWQNRIPLAGAEEVAKVWHLDENVYCLTTGNRVFTFSALTGEFRWSEKLADPATPIFAPSHVDRVPLPEVLGAKTLLKPEPATGTYDLVIFNSVTSALVFERASGRLRAQLDFARAKFAANTSTVCDGVRVFVASAQGRYLAVELISGLAAWKGRTEAMISATPRLMAGNLYLASHDGGVYAIRIGRDEGEKLWPGYRQQQAGGAIIGDIVVSEQGIFAGSTDYNVYALDPTTGQVAWSFRCGRPIRQAVQKGATSIYALAEGDALYAIDLATGERAKWTLRNGRFVLSEMGDTVYVLSDANELMAVDAAIGTVDTVVPLAGLDVFVPNTTTQAVYAGSRDGLICCLRPRGE